jgi:hypothetical protein
MKGALKYIVAILAVLFSLWIIGTSSSFKTCNAEQSAASTEQHKKNLPQFVLSLTDNVAICMRCTGHVLYEYRDAITALATVFIAAFTYTLFAATKGLVETAKIQSEDMKRSIVASEISATAATTQAEVARKSIADIERPYLFVFNVGRLTVQDFYDHDEGEVGYILKTTYDVANHGKIPAIIESLRFNLSVFTEPLDPIAADFDHPFVVAPVLAAGEKRSEIEADVGWRDMGTNEGGHTVPNFGDQTLFLRVVIGYRGPFTSGHETSIGLRYDEQTHRFVEFYTGEKYNYQT